MLVKVPLLTKLYPPSRSTWPLARDALAPEDAMVRLPWLEPSLPRVTPAEGADAPGGDRGRPAQRLPGWSWSVLTVES